MKDFNRILHLEPRDFDALVERSKIYAAQRQFGKALGDLNLALEVKPKDKSAIIYRAEVCKNLKKYGEAAKDYAQAINLDPAAPNLASLYYSLGESLLLGNQLDYAIRALTKTIQLDPKNGLAYANRGVAFKDKGDLLAADSDFRASLKFLVKPSSRQFVIRLLNDVETRIMAEEPKGLVDQVLDIFPGRKSLRSGPKNLW